MISEMETLSKYRGGDGTDQTAFMCNARTIYHRMKLDPNNHRMEGFGEWEFVKMLGVALIGEAGEVHNAFLKNRDPNNERHLEARRIDVPKSVG